jgi:hypothetical protein
MIDFDGMVYCATVPNGTLIVRRNGKAAICGNCLVYQTAAADPDLGRVGLLPSPEQVELERQANIQRQQQQKDAANAPRPPWMPPPPKNWLK